MLTVVNVTEEYKVNDSRAEEYKINDTLRRKRATLLLKSNKDAHKEHKRKERERKRLNKHRKSFAINNPYVDQEPSQTSFSNSNVKSRTVKKVEKRLPQGT